MKATAISSQHVNNPKIIQKKTRQKQDNDNWVPPIAPYKQYTNNDTKLASTQ